MEALLLAGDAVRIDVRVAAGERLEVVETSGTVAYHMRGGHASWAVTAEVGDGAELTWQALPFVVATGADVRRSTSITVTGSGRCSMGEVVVLGRSDETGGRLQTRTEAMLDDVPALVEEFTLDPAARADPALLGGARCIDQLVTIGHRLTDPGALQLDAEGSVLRRRATSAHTARGLATTAEGRVFPPP